MTRNLEDAIAQLPAPLNQEKFSRLRRGIYDADDVEVHMNEAEDFAFLHPMPSVDYTQYRPRAEKLDLAAYKRKTKALERRFHKISQYFDDAGSVLEVGAGDGAFLQLLHDDKSGLDLATLETDQATRPARDKMAWLAQLESFDNIEDRGVKFDTICFFHVLEHIREPIPFLDACDGALSPGGRLIIEVPSMDDPLLSLYRSDDYEGFFYQRQHPFIYSAASLRRLLESRGCRIDAVIPYQRYGLENHMTWLHESRPGGDARLATVLASAEDTYLDALEQAGNADTVIIVATPNA
jgi:2-polyprenyl-3-methyl-5-hydroxy-6-metoxy-1,4-benzoquinol methylase